MRYTFFFLLVVFSFMRSDTAHAVTSFDSYTANSVAVDIQPTYPEANKPVTVVLSSYSSDLNRASFVWKVNNTVVASGVGIKEYTFTAPSNNATTTVYVAITLVSGTLIEKSIPITPQDVDLLIESLDGYTHPFYKGRSLPAKEGLVKVSAIPHLSGVSDSKNAVYSWTQNTKPLPDFSGYGKRYFVYKNGFLDPFDTVSVSTTPRIGAGTAFKQKTINLYEPKVLLYEDHPSQGVLFTRALTDSVLMENNELTVIALPYFLSTQIYGNPSSQNLDYVWKINNTVTDPSEKNRMTLRQPEGAEGQATLEVTIENLSNIFQKPKEADVDILF